MKMMMNMSKIEPQKLAMAVIVGCFLLSVAYFSSEPLMLSFPPSPTGSLHEAAADASNIQQFETKNHTMMQEERNETAIEEPKSQIVMQEEDKTTIKEEDGLVTSPNLILEEKNQTAISEPKNPNVILKEEVISSQPVMQETKITCDLADPRTDVCETKGDVRIHAKSSTIFVINSQADREESWKFKPHPRKGDSTAMSEIRQVEVKSVTGYEAAPSCTINGDVPAIVFSTGGYMGNIFHDYSDALIPLFQTADQFNGEVQFIISSRHDWWMDKYQMFLKHLSKYEILDFEKVDGVLCYRHVIVGLRSTRDLSIDPSKSPNGYSMIDFGKFIRNSYSLERQTAIRLPDATGKKPRLLIIARKKSRRFENVKEIAQMANKLGYQVVVNEPIFHTKVVEFARIVNSCDVMLGVHGAGLTNLVFQPANAVLIQVVPFGQLDNMAWSTFGVPATDMKLRYLDYRITEQESTLIQQYPRDHPVFTDPQSLHRQGWVAMGAVYMDKQNVKLNVDSFRSVLLHALKLLEE